MHEDLGILIPILAVGLSLSIPIVGIVADYRKRHRLIEANHAERMAAIERGIELPPIPADILGGRRMSPRRSTLLPGLIWLFIGIAILCASRFADVFSFFNRDNMLLAGAIPAAVGLALLIYYAVEGRKILAATLEADKARAARIAP